MRDLLIENDPVRKDMSLREKIDEVISHIFFDHPQRNKNYYLDAILLITNEEISKELGKLQKKKRSHHGS